MAQEGMDWDPFFMDENMGKKIFPIAFSFRSMSNEYDREIRNI
jgi:hypothetical protein